MIRLSRMVLGAALIAAVSASTVRAAEPDKLLPANTDSILVVNVPQILGSEIVKKYALEQLKQMLDGQDAKKLLGDLGLDPLKDVETVTFATCDTKIKDIENTQKLAIIRGTFDAEKLFKTAEARSKKEGDKFEMVKDGNTVMFKIQPDNNQPPWYATVVNDKTVIAASEKKLVSATVAAAAASKAAPIKKELADLIKKFDAKTSVFAATLLKGKLDDQKLPAGQGMPFKLDGLEKLLPKMETATISVKVGADCECRSHDWDEGRGVRNRSSGRSRRDHQAGQAARYARRCQRPARQAAGRHPEHGSRPPPRAPT